MTKGVEVITSYGLKAVADFWIAGAAFEIKVTDHNLAQQERSIYAFVAGDEILRIGSSKAKLSARLGAWRRDVSNALAGRKSPTSQGEADGWPAALGSIKGTVFARPGTIVCTPVGEISAYLDEERALIARHKPRFCRR